MSKNKKSPELFDEKTGVIHWEPGQWFIHYWGGFPIIKFKENKEEKIPEGFRKQFENMKSKTFFFKGDKN